MTHCPISFEILARSGDCHARVGRVTTPHGSFDTPAFMAVGTQATIKGLRPDLVSDLGTAIILANTYHLMLRPGSALVAQMGGLQKWMRWPGPILTDSGGFQVFSLSDINCVTDEGVTFRSHLDGTQIALTPRESIRVQNELGGDIIMALDDCPPLGLPADARAPDPEPGRVASCRGDPQRVAQACERTIRWLGECVDAHERKADQALFGIVQGGTDLDLRRQCVQQVCQHNLAGYAIGGVAVGEGFDQLRKVVECTAPLLPDDRPRYLMGVGYEWDILTAVRAGVDMFDCVLPTRNGRSASAFTRTGRIRLRNAQYAQDTSLIEADCDCPACGGGFTRSYLRHLFQAGEMLGPILVSAHNLRHFNRYLLDIRRAISDNSWSSIAPNWPVLADS